MMIQKTIDLFRGLLRMVSPPPRTSVSQWADENRYIPADYGAEPGKWNSDRAKYQRPIMDAFTTKGVRKVVAMLAAQLGKSEILFNVMGRFIHQDPCPMLLVQPTIEDSEDFSKERFSPTVKVTPVLKKLVSDSKSRDSNNTMRKKNFPGGYLAFVGANAPSGLAKRSIRILLGDEVDRFEKSAGSEGDPIDIAAKRTSNFWDAIIGLFSTCTDEFSRILAEYSLGSQEEWRHKCPNCGEYHWVTLWDMRYEYETFEVDYKKTYRVDAVFWRCPDCGKEFTEQQMKNTEQKYIVLNPAVTSVRSFRVNSFASPWLSWKTLIGEYLDTNEKEENVKVFVNTRLAEIYKQTGDIKDERILMQRREQYNADLPDGVLLLTAAVDTQDNRLEYEVCGWGEEEECWGIKKGVVLGIPDRKETWDELDQQLDRLYYFANGVGLKVARTFIDSGGHYTADVYKYCLANAAKQRIAIKGHRLAGVPLLYRLGEAKGYAIPLMMLGVSEGKQYVMERLINAKAPGAKYFHFPSNEFKGYDQLYFRGLISEKKVPKMVRGQMVRVWTNIAQDKRNEPLDLRVYNLACLHSINPNWQAYKEAIRGIKAAETPQEKQKNKPEKQYGCVKKSQVEV